MIPVDLVKRLASRCPLSWQMTLRKLRYRWLIATDRFGPEEPEQDRLTEWVGPGDWVIDVGANIGTYAIAFSRLVGPEGRIIALEPVPTTFRLLTANVGALPTHNITLLNIAASDRLTCVSMNVPTLDSGLDNLYQSRIVEEGSLSVLTFPLDSFGIDRPIRLIKVDVEGHEMKVLRGASRLIERDRPILILEGDRKEFQAFLGPLGYERQRLADSPNTVFLPSRTHST